MSVEVDMQELYQLYRSNVSKRLRRSHRYARLHEYRMPTTPSCQGSDVVSEWLRYISVHDALIFLLYR